MCDAGHVIRWMSVFTLRNMNKTSPMLMLQQQTKMYWGWIYIHLYVVLESAQYFTDRLTLSFSLQFLSGAFICILIVPVLIIWDILTVWDGCICFPDDAQTLISIFSSPSKSAAHTASGCCKQLNISRWLEWWWGVSLGWWSVWVSDPPLSWIGNYCYFTYPSSGELWLCGVVNEVASLEPRRKGRAFPGP